MNKDTWEKLLKEIRAYLHEEEARLKREYPRWKTRQAKNLVGLRKKRLPQLLVPLKKAYDEWKEANGKKPSEDWEPFDLVKLRELLHEVSEDLELVDDMATQHYAEGTSFTHYIYGGPEVIEIKVDYRDDGTVEISMDTREYYLGEKEDIPWRRALARAREKEEKP
jgi:hypothetical protein